MQNRTLLDEVVRFIGVMDREELVRIMDAAVERANDLADEAATAIPVERFRQQTA